MTRRELATKLVSAENESERKDLIGKNEPLADAKLAWKLKDICYESWTNEPTIAQETATTLETLIKFSSDKEIKAISHWISGISELTKGNLEKTSENLDKAAEIFEQIGKRHESAHTKVAKLIPLGLLGKYDEAIKTGQNVLREFENFGDELAAGKVEMNLGHILTRRGEYKKGKDFCESALKRFIKIDEKEWQTMAENSLAFSYSELNNFRKAEKFYARALETAKQAKMLVTQAEIEASLGKLATFRGNYSDALNFLEISRRKFQDLKMPHEMAIADLEIGEIYQTLSLIDESFEIYEETSKIFKKLKLQSEEARTRRNLGNISVKKGFAKKARKELQSSAKLYLAEKNVTGAASVKLSEADMEIKLGNFGESLEIILAAKKLLKESDILRLKLKVNFLHGDVLRLIGKLKSATKVLEKTFSEALQNEQKTLAQNCLNSLGKMAFQNGDLADAKKYFQKSIEIIETLRSPLPAEEFRIAFLANNLKPFENLTKIYIEQNDFEEAFITIEKAKSRSLAETIQAIGKKPQANDIANKDLQEKLDNLREELNWFYSRLSRAKDKEVESLQNSIKNSEKQIAETMRQIDSTKRSEFLNKNDPIVIDELQKQLGKDQVLIEYVKFEENYSAFVITDKKIEYCKDLADESEIVSLLEGLQFQFGAMRYGKDFSEKFANNLKKKADFYLQKLYEKLLEPLTNLIKNKNLVIIPVSTLFYVPFCGLFDGEKYQIEAREIVTSPSALVWKTLIEKTTKKRLQEVLLMGFEDENIPLVNKEIATLKKLYQNSKSFTGKESTFTNYKKNSENKDILHLACHGQFRQDNPLFSSLHLADGFVTVRDICSQNLNAELVTLSACETGLNKIHAGDEILGLTRGFLTAGVKTLLLSLWTVNDAATKELMKEFYTELQLGKSIPASIQNAQNKFIKDKKHPYFWASFGIIGK